eukprot:gene4334-788_t
MASPPAPPVPEVNQLKPGFSRRVFRDWHSADVILSPSMLVFPIFISDNDDAMDEIADLPGNYHIGVNRVANYLKPLVAKGLKTVLLFGHPSKAPKDERGSAADDPNGPVIRGIRQIRHDVPHLTIIAD